MAIIDIVGFRHGETDLNKTGILQGGSIDLDLNLTGYDQADTLSEVLAKMCEGYDGIHILTSNLLRAKNTMYRIRQNFSEILKGKIRSYGITEDLRERSFGSFEGQDRSAFDSCARYLEYKALDTIQAKRAFSIADDVETDDALIRRAGRSINRIIHQQSGVPSKDLLILSTHGNMLRTLLAGVFDQLEYPPLANCAHVKFPVTQWQQVRM